MFFSVSLSKGLMNLSKHTRKKLNDYFANLVPMTFALFCVWFFNGIWHGASWKYVLYGLYYYILMMIGMYLRPVSDKLLHALHIAPESKGFALFQDGAYFSDRQCGHDAVPLPHDFPVGPRAWRVSLRILTALA